MRNHKRTHMQRENQFNRMIQIGSSTGQRQKKSRSLEDEIYAEEDSENNERYDQKLS